MSTSCRLARRVSSVCKVGHAWPAALVSNLRCHPQKQSHLEHSRRQYAQPANLNIPAAKTAFKAPPAPPGSTEPTTVEDGHSPGEAQDASGPFDNFLAKTAQALKSRDATSVPQLHSQYRERGGRMCSYVVPYEERPSQKRRADSLDDNGHRTGDGIVMVVHALYKTNGRLDKVCACSGFVVDAQSVDRSKQNGEVVVTCAHTLEEMHRNIQRVESQESRISMSFVISSTGEARRVQEILSSMPRSDIVAMQLEASEIPDALRLRTLPLTPFPVHSGMMVLTHLFGASHIPNVVRSQSRLPPSAKEYYNVEEVEAPLSWLDGQAWRRWGAGNMLGYRSYTNIEVEAGIHSSLPHILTSILPGPGSSGGPLVNSETGAVVGVISGRRMDNRVEGERGWGASSESIFEMFSLPGFTPTSKGS